jgi:hypothetical protein
MTVDVCINVETDYPKSGYITLKISADEPVDFVLRLRKPSWVDGKGGYIEYDRTWNDDSVELSFDMSVKIHKPELLAEDTVYTDVVENYCGYYTALPVKTESKSREEKYIAFTRGPITLAADSRTGKSPQEPFSLPTDYQICESIITDGAPCLLKMKFTPENGAPYYLVDYGHAGRDWKSIIAAWLPTE